MIAYSHARYNEYSFAYYVTELFCYIGLSIRLTTSHLIYTQWTWCVVSDFCLQTNTSWTFKGYSGLYIYKWNECIILFWIRAYSNHNCQYQHVNSFTLLPRKRARRSHFIIYWCPSITTTMKPLQSIFCSPSMIMGAIGHHGDESSWIIYDIIVWPGHNMISCRYKVNEMLGWKKK